jgi:hypothetical protein
MDFIIDLPPFSSYDFVLVVVDYLTKMAHIILCTKIINSEGTTKLFIDHVFQYHGFFKDIISDCGLKFASKFWKHLFELLSVNEVFISFPPLIDG